MTDNLIHPQHYIEASATIEPIDVLRYAPFDLGNALKYILRAGLKGDALTDLEKAMKYLWWSLEGTRQKGAIYEEFLSHYGLILNKFKQIENLYNESMSAYGYVRNLIKFVEERKKQEYIVR